MTEAERLRLENSRLTQELKQRLFELSILYDISNSISYTLDYDDFLALVMDSLHRIIDYDLCTSLIILEEEKKAKMVMRIAHPLKREIIEEVKAKTIKALSSLGNRSLTEEDIILDLKGDVSEGNLNQNIKSSFDVPLFVRNEAVGILNVGKYNEILPIRMRR